MGIGKTENKERFMCTGVRQETLCYRNWNIFPCVVSIGPQNLGSGLWVLVWPLEVRRLLLLWSVDHSNHTTPVQQEQLGGVVVVVVLCVGFTQHWCLCKYGIFSTVQIYSYIFSFLLKFEFVSSAKYSKFSFSGRNAKVSTPDLCSLHADQLWLQAERLQRGSGVRAGAVQQM